MFTYGGHTHSAEPLLCASAVCAGARRARAGSQEDWGGRWKIHSEEHIPSRGWQFRLLKGRQCCSMNRRELHFHAGE